MTTATESKLNKDGLLKSSPATIYVYGGGTIEPLNPNPDDIKLETIAHCLSNMCRWTGNTIEFMSVAEHSVLASRITEDLETLMHDGQEAFICDLARPLKQAEGFGEKYLEIERGLEEAIATRFGLRPPPMSKETKYADDQMLFREAKELVPHLGVEMPEPDEGTPWLELWSPKEAEKAFISRFFELGGKT